jgi:hypothetical protein
MKKRSRAVAALLFTLGLAGCAYRPREALK